MHLKNLSLIRWKNKIELSPAYDLLNTTIAIQAKEEIALPIRGKKSRLNRFDLIDYFGGKRLGLPETIIQEELSKFEGALESCLFLIEQSFLSQRLQENYRELIKKRWNRIAT